MKSTALLAIILELLYNTINEDDMTILAISYMLRKHIL